MIIFLRNWHPIMYVMLSKCMYAIVGSAVGAAEDILVFTVKYIPFKTFIIHFWYQLFGKMTELYSTYIGDQFHVYSDLNRF